MRTIYYILFFISALTGNSSLETAEQSTLRVATASVTSENVNELLDTGHLGLKWTFLHQAIYSRNVEGVKSLLKIDGIDLNQPDSANILPLTYACQKGNIEIIELLLNAGAEVNQQVRVWSGSCSTEVKEFIASR